MNIIPFHKKQSRPVESYREIKEEALELKVLADGKFPPPHTWCLALQHAQVSDDPFNFFVLSKPAQKIWPVNDWLIMNPRILEKSKERSLKSEGCMSFPNRANKKILRHDRILVEYQSPRIFGKGIRKLWLEGLPAEIFQHELDHAHGLSVYDR